MFADSRETRSHQMTQQYSQNRVPPRRGALPRRAKPAAHSKLPPALIMGSAAAVGILLFLGVIALIAAVALAPDRIASNVAVAGIDLGGKTGAAAERALQQALDDASITAVDGERTWPLQLSDLGVSID